MGVNRLKPVLFGLVGAGLVSLFGFDGSLVENGVEVWLKME